MVGFRKPRKPRPKKTGVPKGYDSLWEVKLHETVLKDWKHHWEQAGAPHLEAQPGTP